ncbi:MAG: excinuclease ABC subunit UvrA, partial [Paenibacillaceae bacterium]|nr:excinuclease ABC subunit UvrA [Paenibacillaceae bacterium]
MAQQHIVVRGARTHNLQNIDVHIPRDAFVVMTGLSGSGKSSLAFDTIFAEGQRRYVESLSSYARQFLGQMDKPDVDAIEGLSPAVAIDQKTTSRNPRSTVGTVTEIYDYLRLLYARIGVPHCPTHDIAIQMQTIEQMVDRILAYGEDEKLIILSPVVASKKGEHTKTLESIKKQGFVRVRINGDIVDVHQDIQLPKHRQHTIDIDIDRLIVRAHDAARLAESLETAVRQGDGTVIVHRMSSNEDVVMSAKSACPKCGLGIGVLEPRMFSFNSPLGACPTCGGLGVRQQVDLRRVCPDDSLTLNEGALLPWTAAEEQKYFPMYLKAACAFLRIDMNTPVRDIHKEKWKELLYGDVETMHTLQFSYVSSFGEQRKAKTPFVGLIPQLEARYASAQAREYVSEYMTEQPCEACAGKRLSPLVLAVRIQGASIYDVTQLSIKEAVAFMDALDLPPAQRAIAAPIVSEIRARLSFLCNVGLDYLTLGRSAATLSGGESQRIRLATQIGSQLSGVLYVLDEPSIGLHQRDNDRLIATLKHMRDLGNTLLVVEHDEDTIRACDFVV